MAGFRSSFEGNVDTAYGRGVTDLTSQIDQRVKQAESGLGSMTGLVKGAQKAREQVRGLNQEIDNLKQQQAVAKNAQDFVKLGQQIEQTRKSLVKMKKDMANLGLEKVANGFGSITKGLISMNTSILTMGFDFLIDSIKRVYELQERWAKAIGGFNMKLGGMTAGLKGATQAATRWSGVVRGLTNGDIGEGIELFGEFTLAIGRVVKRGDDFEKFGLQMARGFNLGGAGAGELSKVLGNIGMTGDEAAESMKILIKASAAAGVPTNMIAKDVLDSSKYMARFGKEGQKTFIQGAAYARKFTMSMEQLKASVEGLDMFDEAAKTAARLNTVFGTMINSMDLMMEDDPAKRLEMIRQQFLAQGKTFDTLSVKQRRLLSETLKLTEDQTAALLKSSDAGKTYADFQAEASKKQEKELSAKKMMEKQLRATSQTMYAFGAAFDRITVAIANAIKPILQVFGLAKSGEKDFKSFGKVMESITVTVEEFFNSLARNDKWNVFMITLAKDLKKAAGAMRDFVMDGRAADLIGDIAGGMKTFYIMVRDAAKFIVPAMRPVLNIFLKLSEYIKELAVVWAGLKAVSFVRGMTSGMTAPAAAPSPFGPQTNGAYAAMAPNAKRGLGGFSGVANRGAMGAVGGVAAGMAMGGTGAMAGGAIGGAIGAFIPIIGPLMGPLGAAIGKGIEELFGSSKVKSKLEEAMEKLATTQQEAVISGERLEKSRTLNEAKRNAENARHSFADKAILKLKKGQIDLTDAEKIAVKARLEQLQGFGKKTEFVTAALEALKNNGDLTKEMFVAVKDAQDKYKDTVQRLDKASAFLANSAELQAKLAGLEVDKKTAELTANTLDQEIAILEKEKADALAEDKRNGAGLSRGQKAVGFVAGMVGGGGASQIVKTTDPKYMAMQAKQNDFAKKIEAKKLEKANALQAVAATTRDLNKEMLGVMTQEAVMNTEAFRKYAAKQVETGGNIDTKNWVRGALWEVAQQSGRSVDEIRGAYKFAKGGIVSRPTMGLIGEAGPEAVIPLKAAVSGRAMVPYQARDDKHRNLLSPKAASDGGAMVYTQIADVHLDGTKVGRAIVKTALQR